METFTLNIDGIVVEASPGTTVLQAAKKAGLFIPSLCAHDELNPYGACRLCVVEIDGVRGTPTSCTTPATPGMVVRTNTEQLQLQRRRTIELMLSGHPSPCLICDSREDCEREKVQPTRATSATRCGACANRPGCELRGAVLGNYIRDIGLPAIYDPAKVERNDPFIDKNHNLCILCGRCFRVCEKIHDKPAIAIVNRGKKAKIASEFEKAWSGEECLFCGACVEECPTGCLTDRWGKWFGFPDKTAESVCPLCPKHCKISLKIKDARVVGTKSVSLEKRDNLCVLGKFVYPQLINSRERLARAYVGKGKEQIPASRAEVAERLGEIFKDAHSAMLMIIPKGACIETRAAARALADFFKSDLAEPELDSGEESLPPDMLRKLSGGEYKAVVAFGNYISVENAKKAGRLVVADFLKTDPQNFAEVVVPAAVLAEDAGTLFTEDGGEFLCSSLVSAPGDGVRMSEILSELCKSLDLDASKYMPRPEKITGTKFPTSDKSAIPSRFMGHYLADYAPDLAQLGLPFSPGERENAGGDDAGSYEILGNKTLAPNFHELTVLAPEVAKFAKPGQFAILMANPHSERSPFTIIDWNAAEGWVKFIIEEVGRSSAEIASLSKGDKLCVVSGPLGTPVDLELFAAGTSVLLAGGCYGIGAIYPVARALKGKGVKVTAAIEASSSYMLYYADELSKYADDVVIRTRDGTFGRKGGNLDTVAEIGSEYDALIAVGCVFMMKQVASKTPLGDDKVQLCALNPIMVDGTGMCGACRVNVGGETKFACVDGPFFDLRKVDFSELGKRRNAYKLLEIEAMPRHIGGKCRR